MLLDSGTFALEDSSTAELPDISGDSGTDELEDLTSTELDTGAALEDELSGDCAELEVPAEDISEEEGREPSAFASPESSPQAIRPAVVSAHKKTRA